MEKAGDEGFVSCRWTNEYKSKYFIQNILQARPNKYETLLIMNLNFERNNIYYNSRGQRFSEEGETWWYEKQFIDYFNAFMSGERKQLMRRWF